MDAEALLEQAVACITRELEKGLGADRNAGRIKQIQAFSSYVKANGMSPEAMQGLFSQHEGLPQKMIKRICGHLQVYLANIPVSLRTYNSLYKKAIEQNKGSPAWNLLRLRWFAEHNRVRKVDRILRTYAKHERLKALIYLSKVMVKLNQLDQALLFASKAVELDPQSAIATRRLIAIHHQLGNIGVRLRLIKKLQRLTAKVSTVEYEMARDEHELQLGLWTWRRNASPIKPGQVILHVLNKSLPEINGYTIRSSEMVRHEVLQGLKVAAVTKLGWPNLGVETPTEIRKEAFGGVNYYRLYDSLGTQLNKVPHSVYFDRYAEQLAEMYRRIRPAVVHAASNFQNALPAITVAKRLEIPCIYEVRGMWQDTRSFKTPGFESSERYLLHEMYEIYCCRLADKVVTISDSLRIHLIRLGVNASKIHVIPNGADPDRFRPIPPDETLMKRYGLKGCYVLGFIGSLEAYEGLDLLFAALHLLKKEKGLTFKMLIIGEGPAKLELVRLAAELEISEAVHFIGKIPHHQIPRYYSVIDAFPFPRRKAKVCEIVTPLKPYEALAMAKTVIVSDIPALKEIISHEETGLVFKAEDVRLLAHHLLLAQSNPELGASGRQWIIEHRSWSCLAKQYKELYEQVTEENRGVFS